MKKRERESHPDKRNSPCTKAERQELHCKAGMINFMGQIDWAIGCPDIWFNISGYLSEGVPG